MSTKAVFAEISSDEFHALEEKVYRTIEMLKSAREERACAEREASRLRAELVARDDEMAANRAELTRLRREREEVRTRVEKIMKQIDALAQEESALQYS
jgi:chromosome segregation ATPase